MNPKQFCTLEEAQKLVAVFGPLGIGAIAEIPKYAPEGMETPKYDETHLMYMIHFGNGFVDNGGLLLNKIAILGSEGAAWDSLKAEMQERKLMTAWWAARPTD